KLGYGITDGVINVATADELKRNVTTQTHDIRDLLVIAPDFDQPPDFDLSANSNGRNNLASRSPRNASGRSSGNWSHPRNSTGANGAVFSNQNTASAYPVGNNAQEKTESLVHQITDLIRENIDRESWVDNGGKFGSLKFLSGQLIVTQTPENQNRIVSL